MHEASSGHASPRPFRRSGPRCVFSSTMATTGCFWSSSWRKPKEPKVKLPRLLLAAGKASAQYADPEDE